MHEELHVKSINLAWCFETVLLTLGDWDLQIGPGPHND